MSVYVDVPLLPFTLEVADTDDVQKVADIFNEMIRSGRVINWNFQDDLKYVQNFARVPGVLVTGFHMDESDKKVANIWMDELMNL